MIDVSRAAADRGSSLVEVLLATAILGGAAVALLTALATVHALDREATPSATLVVTAASVVDAMRDPARNPFVDCATPADYDPLAGIDDAVRPAVTIEAVAYWDGSGFGAECPDVSGADPAVQAAARLQRITVRVGEGRPIDVVKRGS